jgi:hypothetical protein
MGCHDLSVMAPRPPHLRSRDLDRRAVDWRPGFAPLLEAAAGLALERVAATGQVAGSVVAIEPEGDMRRSIDRSVLGPASAVSLYQPLHEVSKLWVFTGPVCALVGQHRYSSCSASCADSGPAPG